MFFTTVKMIDDPMQVTEHQNRLDALNHVSRTCKIGGMRHGIFCAVHGIKRDIWTNCNIGSA